MKGYALAQALENEAADVAREDRRELMLAAAREIADLVQENRRLFEKSMKLEGRVQVLESLRKGLDEH